MSIQVVQLQKRFNGFVAVKNISFTVNDGEFITLLGPSGSGKSTLLRCVAGLENPTAGKILMDDEDVTHIPVQDREVGFVFQHYALFRHMNVLDNIAFGLKVRGMERKERLEKAKGLLDLVGLNGYEKRMPHQLSGGQRQRVALARALAPEPKVLLLDEPFGALDTRLRKGLRSWLKELHNQIGLTTLLVTHDQDEAFELSDRVLVINQGEVEQDAEPKKLFNEPATEFVASFVGETNKIEGIMHQDKVTWGPFEFKHSRFPAHERPGQKATVVFRPIDVYVSSKRETAEVPGVIVSTQFLGSLEELKIQVQEGLFVNAQLPKGVATQSDFKKGKQVFVGITAFHIFTKD